MTTTPKSLPAKNLENVATLQYQAVACRTTITKATFTNIGTLNNTITVYIVPSGGSAGSSNEIIRAKAISGSETFVASELAGQILAPGESLWALCPAATAITFRLSYIEQT